MYLKRVKFVFGLDENISHLDLAISYLPDPPHWRKTVKLLGLIMCTVERKWQSSNSSANNFAKTQQNAKRFHMVYQVSNWARFMMKTKCPNKLVTLSLTAENWSMLPLKNH